MTNQTEPEMAERHVREGEVRVERQAELVSRMRNDRHNTRQAEDLLFAFETIPAGQREHGKLIRAEQGR